MACGDELLLTDDEAATLLRMLRARLVRLARAGKVPCVILPDCEVRFRRSDLESWVEARTRPARTAEAES
jgi:hypothetical protein